MEKAVYDTNIHSCLNPYTKILAIFRWGSICWNKTKKSIVEAYALAMETLVNLANSFLLLRCIFLTCTYCSVIVVRIKLGQSCVCSLWLLRRQREQKHNTIHKLHSVFDLRKFYAWLIISLVVPLTLKGRKAIPTDTVFCIGSPLLNLLS